MTNATNPMASHGQRRAAGRPRLVGAPVTPHTTDQLRARTRNVVVATVGLIVTAPLMMAIAALVKVTSRGSVLFTQARVGIDRRSSVDRRGRRRIDPNPRRSADYGGMLFEIWKFRTMCNDVTPADAQVWAIPDDPRVTPLGRILRRYRLDELPQLWNVLRGDMNIVGPRPEQPQIFAKLRTRIEHYPKRQRTRPGITGWAQVNGNYDGSTDDVRSKVAYDLEYIGRQSWFEDLKIMLRTLPVIIFRRGAW